MLSITAVHSCEVNADQAAPDGCGLPGKLANFQGYFECNNNVVVGKPSTLSELQAQIQTYDHVKAVGVGHSWWQQQFCSGADSSSANIVLTQMNSTLTEIENPSQDAAGKATMIVNEDFGIVTVQAGVPQRALLDYLATYSSKKAPQGYTLPAFSWFIDQTIGGAVATATHGSSFLHGSLSNQVTSIQAVLANGTLANFSPHSNQHLWRAMQVSVGRLGVITQLSLSIMPQQAVQRAEQDMTAAQFAQQVKQVQDAYTQAKQSGSSEAIWTALHSLNETQCFWFVPTGDLWRVEYQRLEEQPQDATSNTTPEVTAQDGPDSNVGTYAQQEQQPVSPNGLINANPQTWSNTFATGLRSVVAPGTYEARNAYLSQSEQMNVASSNFAPYDQYEVSIPMDIAGDCLQMVLGEIDSKQLGQGFRTPGLIRFVSQETGYLSPTSDGPRMFVNLEDYLSHTTGQPNTQFQTVISLFHDKCQGRLHWGKAGWPEHEPCYDGSVHLPNTWCHFGCAVQELDPTGKFASESNVWDWTASKQGQNVTFSNCCGPDGFNSDCTCAPRQTC